MTALRTTRPNTDRPLPTPPVVRDASFPRAFFVCLGAVLPGVSGCGDSATGVAEVPAVETRPYRPTMTQLPPPATDRIEYDAATRTLTLYDVPGGTGRWMVRASDAKDAVPAGPDHVVPEGVDPDTTFVYYRRPGGQTSRFVSLAQIQAAREMHSSQIR